MKILQTNTNEYVVEQREDGTLSITCGGEPIKNAGAFILNLGGIDAVLARCKEYTTEELRQKHIRNIEAKKRRKMEYLEIERQRRAKVEKAYMETFKEDVTQTTVHSVYVLLNYLRYGNWGAWELPKMSIGYSCQQYDCDGKIAVTIKLDKPIEIDGEMISRFQAGAPRGHLTKYYRIADTK